MAKDIEIETKAPPARRVRLEYLAQEKKLAPHVLAGVLTHRHWDESTEVTEAEFAAAVSEVGNIRIG